MEVYSPKLSFRGNETLVLRRAGSIPVGFVGSSPENFTANLLDFSRSIALGRESTASATCVQENAGHETQGASAASWRSRARMAVLSTANLFWSSLS